MWNGQSRAAVVFGIALAGIASLPAQAQCTPQSLYVVTTQQELIDALNCIASTCSEPCPSTCLSGAVEIIIPEDTDVELDVGFNIGCRHSRPNRPLTITIEENAALIWVGGGNDNWTLFNINGASHLTFRGSGGITCSHNPPSVRAFRTTGVDHFTVDGLSFSKLNDVLIQNDSPSSNVTLTNLTATNLHNYGVYIDAGSIAPHHVQNVTITNCHISNTVHQYPFRISADHLTMTNCSGMDAGAGQKAGLWIPAGRDMLIDGFNSNCWCRIGSNVSAEDGGEPLRRVVVRNFTISGVPSTASVPGRFVVFPDVLDCEYENIRVEEHIIISPDMHGRPDIGRYEQSDLGL